MEEFTPEETDSAKKFVDFYVDLIENKCTTIRYYLAENVVLDWFGQTVKGSKKVSLFIHDQISNVAHHISSTTPSAKVGFRDTHKVKVQRTDDVTIVATSPVKEDETTPSTSFTEMGQGDGAHNGNIVSPPKKIKLGGGDGIDNDVVEDDSGSIKYLTSDGSVEFHKPSVKKLQNETKWKRPMKLHLGYKTSSFKDSTIYLIIYEGNLKCRRNLFKEFCDVTKSTP